MTKATEIQRYKRALRIAIDALTEYSDPSFYHAVAFAFFDRPCGDFYTDFSSVKPSGYNRHMPGKRARAALTKLSKLYGDLDFFSRMDDEP